MWEIAVHLAVACDVYDGVFFVLFFPRGVLDEILNLIESVSEGFPSYFFIEITYKLAKANVQSFLLLFIRLLVIISY